MSPLRSEIRKIGRRPATWFKLVACWILAIPTAAWLVLYAGRELQAIWWALCLGLAVVACLLVVWIRLRGPARAALDLG